MTTNLHEWETRYARQISLPQWGKDGQKKLSKSSVLVIGAGGLGAPLLLYLAGAGIGRIGVIEFDRVALSNLPRQIAYETADIGRLKAEAMRDVLLDRNPDLTLEIYTQKIDSSNARELISSHDIVADGSDNFATRLAVNAACYQQKKTLVSAAVMGWEGHISTFVPHRGVAHPCYQCWVGSGEQPEDASCSISGVMGSVAGMLACQQATEVIKELLGVGESLSGRMLRFNALIAQWSETRLMRDSECSVCG